jgi:hypothetical protein
MKYCLEELRLLCFVLRCFVNGQYVVASLRNKAPSEDSTSTLSSDSEDPSSDADDSPSSDDDTGASKRRTCKTNKPYSIILTDDQLVAVQNLNHLLKTAKYNSKQLKRAIETLTETLYMPSNTADMVDDEFSSVVRAMYCLRAVFEHGGFVLPKYITTFLVALQCGIRLCILRVVLRMLQECRQSGRASHEDQWFR